MTAFAELATTLEAVAATRSRTAKIAALAELLGRLDPAEVEATTHFLSGQARQGRIGVGWATVFKVAVEPATEPTLSIGEVDRTFDRLGAIGGAGSNTERQRTIGELMAAATALEQDLLRRLLLGEIRTGALAGIVTDAAAKATGVPLAALRRAAMLSGDLGHAAAVARTGGLTGLEAVGLTTMRPVQPMLAGTSASVTEAVSELGLASVEWKLDGARVQIHRAGDDVAIFTRNLNDITDRLPGVVAMVRSLPVRDAVFDGEVLGLDEDGRPDRFQDTMSRFGGEARSSPPGIGGGRSHPAGAQPTLRAFLFDVLHADGTDLLDEPLSARLDVLEQVAGPHRIPHLLTADGDEAERFAERALAAGHEGVMVKAIESPYEAGRRGKRWLKVKPVRTLDLVVIAAEWGHGRRQGWLSNLHLGARGPDGTFVMVGKTFKGLTDVLLEWQTTELLAREIGRDGIVVHVRPELVAEIALDGVQVSRRYPGGVAMRFARVKRYRPDKRPGDADTIGTVQALLVTTGATIDP